VLNIYALEAYTEDTEPNPYSATAREITRMHKVNLVTESKLAWHLEKYDHKCTKSMREHEALCT
jgi:hypothetical protein